MTRQQVLRQITAILEANSLSWSETPSGGIYLRFSSAGVAIDLKEWGSQTLVAISSHVLVNVDGKTKQILKELNALNVASNFGRWVYYEGPKAVSIEYDLLGDHLQEDELMTALAALARRADYHDDLLQKKLGGVRAFEV
ncbi:hypothetical protein P6281_10605 [Mycobacterium sp. 5-140-3-2]|uniref:T3SS (YopN, CesT) and YbjN peptide-binding chaperone 1 n=1 Tax=Mycobacterium TaxID=1763 RepID=UPI0019255BA4|nr:MULTISPECIES: hypothetical protein [Mycobacterium]WRU84287.1 hypothetical protein P6281_10605 [Mycobacterium sp. 5-140-3-2]WSE39569.1 hypothetical protein QGN28_15510 [Mycobacterium sp. 5-140-3-1]BCO83705.1 hypothetical protein MINTM011_20400 [Mycobacterium paraintracellulare]